MADISGISFNSSLQRQMSEETDPSKLDDTPNSDDNAPPPPSSMGLRKKRGRGRPRSVKKRAALCKFFALLSFDILIRTRMNISTKWFYKRPSHTLS